MSITRGIKKVSENILSDGRAIIVTEKDKDNYVWADIPNGSLFIDTTTGIMQVKIEGESDWVPAGLKNDGTLCIAKDTKLVTEIYTIVNPDEGDGNFSCTDGDGNTRHFPLTNEGYPVFYLEKGSYQMQRNQISLMIDDCLYRSVASGDLTELGETRIQLNEQLKTGQKVTITYSNVVRIGNPYPRIFINDNEPDTKAAEIGDLWIDTDFDYANYGKYLDVDDGKLDWNKIKNTPTSLSGYGITDSLSLDGHTHSYNDLTDKPLTNVANGGRADTADKLSTPRNFNITGEITGSGVFDGTSDCSINTTIDQTLLHQHIINIVGVDDLVKYIRNNTSRIDIVTGIMSPSQGAYIPIPAGFSRNQCKFIVYPLSASFTSSGAVVNAAVSISASLDLVVDMANGLIQSNPNNSIKVIGYAAIGLKDGGT